MKFFKKYGVLIAALFIVSMPALAALKVWVSGETLRYSDLNSNFSTINTSATRSLVNADISGSAAIAHSKLATPGLVSKIAVKVGVTGTPCPGAGCTVTPSYGGTVTAARTSAGIYAVTIPTAGSTNFMALASSNTARLLCAGTQTNATTVTVSCEDTAGALTDSVFSLLVLY